jgi:hypothetical protein
MEERACLSLSAVDLSEKWIFSWLFISTIPNDLGEFPSKLFPAPKAFIYTFHQIKKSFFSVLVGNVMQYFASSVGALLFA